MKKGPPVREAPDPFRCRDLRYGKASCPQAFTATTS
jgi:hypothetical protein